MKRRSIVFQVGLTSVFLVVFAALINSMLILRFSEKKYMEEKFSDAKNAASYVASIIENDEFEYLVPFWLENKGELNLVHDDKRYVEKLLIEINKFSTELVASEYFSKEKFNGLPEIIQKKYAEYEYLKIESSINAIKKLYDLDFLGVVSLAPGKITTLINGKSEGQVRGDEMGQVFSLGHVYSYEGSLPVAEKTWKTGMVQDELDLRIFTDKERSSYEGQVYHPIVHNGNTLCMVMINILVPKMRHDLVGQIRNIFIISICCFAVLGILIYFLVVCRIKKIAAHDERLSTELEMAGRIQESFLPGNRFEDGHMGIRGFMKPAIDCGGDFYDYFSLDESRIAFVIGDVSGRGVGASLFMAKTLNALRLFAGSGFSPKEIFEKLNQILCDNNEKELFVTCWLGIYDVHSKKMLCANAGHGFPLICHEGGHFDYYRDVHSFVLGGMKEVPYKEYEIQMNEGDTLFVYTDGISEQVDRNDEMFGDKRLLEILNENRSKDPDALVSAIRNAVTTFQGFRDQFDDITMMVVQFK